jgi:hypothetical protein
MLHVACNLDITIGVIADTDRELDDAGEYAGI